MSDLPNEDARLNMVIDMVNAVHIIRTQLEIPTRGPIMGEAPAPKTAQLSALDSIRDSVITVTNQLQRASRRIEELEARLLAGDIVELKS